jgi:hypothetical protein
MYAAMLSFPRSDEARKVLAGLGMNSKRLEESMHAGLNVLTCSSPSGQLSHSSLDRMKDTRNEPEEFCILLFDNNSDWRLE